ncbi:MAG: FtsX-like permease family protein [Bryobacteraceae bacterium]
MWRTIVGISGGIRNLGPAKEPDPELYVPLQQWSHPVLGVSVLIRTSGDPMNLARPVKRGIAAIDPDLPVSDIRALDRVLSENLAAPRLQSSIFEVLAGIALLFSVGGLYSVMAYLVGQRTQEIGVRMALGAGPGQVLGWVLGQGARSTILGLAIGSVGSIATVHLLRRCCMGSAPTIRAFSRALWCCCSVRRCWPAMFRRAARRGSIRLWL